MFSPEDPAAIAADIEALEIDYPAPKGRRIHGVLVVDWLRTGAFLLALSGVAAMVLWLAVRK